MFCPKCGNSQVSGDVRFCTKCGFALESTSILVSAGVGALAETSTHKRQLSPRAKGILQGIAIVPGAFGAWLALDIFYEGVFGAGMLGGLYAIITLILLTGALRVMYAIFLEDGHQRERPVASEAAALNTSSLDEQEPPLIAESDAPGHELEPRSVTENTTTRLEIK